MNVVSPLRITVDDLPDIDKKTRAGLQPLLDQLNVFAQQVNALALSIPTEVPTSGTFTTDAVGAAVVNVTQKTPKATSAVSLDALTAADGSPIASPYAMSWRAVGTQAVVQFSGLEVQAKYQFTLTLK